MTEQKAGPAASDLVDESVITDIANGVRVSITGGPASGKTLVAAIIKKALEFYPGVIDNICVFTNEGGVEERTKMLAEGPHPDLYMVSVFDVNDPHCLSKGEHQAIRAFFGVADNVTQGE